MSVLKYVCLRILGVAADPSHKINCGMLLPPGFSLQEIYYINSISTLIDPGYNSHHQSLIVYHVTVLHCFKVLSFL